MANMSRGNLVILCMGRRRKDWMLRFWQHLSASRRRRYSLNITQPGFALKCVIKCNAIYWVVF